MDEPTEVTCADFTLRCEQSRKRLLGYAYMCCRDLNLAEDIVQETMLIAFQKQAQYFPTADFMSWLISIARYVWLRERGKRKVDVRARQFIEENAMLFFEGPRYEEAEWNSEREALQKCLLKLPDCERGLISAHFGGCQKYESMAQNMGRTVSWVKARMSRARAALIECVKRMLAETERGGA